MRGWKILQFESFQKIILMMKNIKKIRVLSCNHCPKSIKFLDITINIFYQQLLEAKKFTAKIKNMRAFKKFPMRKLEGKLL